MLPKNSDCPWLETWDEDIDSCDEDCVSCYEQANKIDDEYADAFPEPRYCPLCGHEVSYAYYKSKLY